MGSIVSLPGQWICTCLIKFLINTNSCDFFFFMYISSVYIYTPSSMLGILALRLSAYQFVSMHKYLKLTTTVTNIYIVRWLFKIYQHQQPSQHACKEEKNISILSCSTSYSVTGDLQPWITSPSSISGRLLLEGNELVLCGQFLTFYLWRPLRFALLLQSLFKMLLSEKDMRKISKLQRCLGLFMVLPDPSLQSSWLRQQIAPSIPPWSTQPLGCIRVAFSRLYKII